MFIKCFLYSDLVFHVCLKLCKFVLIKVNILDSFFPPRKFLYSIQIKPTQYLILPYFRLLFHEDLQVTSPTFFLPPLTSLVYKEARAGTQASVHALHHFPKSTSLPRTEMWMQTPCLEFFPNHNTFLLIQLLTLLPNKHLSQIFTQDFPNLIIHEITWCTVER